MLVALEGMDGVGKSTLAKKCAQLLGGFFVVKAIHPLRDKNVYYDNFYNISDLVLEIFKSDFDQCMFGIRGIFWYYRLNGFDIVSDRFYASNLWHIERRDVDIENMVSFIGIPEKTVLLYASQDVLKKRIWARNPQDKDLVKIEQSEYAYRLMKTRFNKNGINYSIINTDDLPLDSVAERILSTASQDEPAPPLNATMRAFSCKRKKITEIFIDEDINFIDPKAFFYLSNLQCIKVSDSNKYFSCLNGVLYSKNQDILYCYPNNREEKNFTVPRTVKYLMPSAFINASCLENIILHDGVIEIGSTCFFNCRMLKSFAVSAELRRIGPMNFLGCSNMEAFSVASDNTVYSEISKMLFSHDGTNLIKIPSAIPFLDYKFCCQKVSAWAGADVSTIKRIDFDDKLEIIEAYAFFNSNVEKINITSSNLTRIGERAFGMCKNLRNLDISSAPISISIHNDAFENASEKLRIYISDILFEKLVRDPKKEHIKKHFAVRLFDKKQLSCGAACCIYLKKKLDLTISIEEDKTYWIFSIARQFLQYIPCLLYYYDSNLMRDYYSRKIPDDFSGTADLEEIIQSQKICCKKLDKDNLIHAIRDCFILMIVDSQLLNDDATLTGGHYIIIEHIEGTQAIIVNPLKSVAILHLVDVDLLVEGCLKQGGWYMTISRTHKGVFL